MTTPKIKTKYPHDVEWRRREKAKKLKNARTSARRTRKKGN